MSNESKMKLIQEAYVKLGNANVEVTCISDIKYLKPEGFGANGRPIVDWPKKWDLILRVFMQLLERIHCQISGIELEH